MIRRKLGGALLIALLLAILVKSLLFAPFFITSQSMEPTIKNQDKIIISKIFYNFRIPSRGDVIVFYFPLDPNKKMKYIKRIIGLPGETIAIKNNKVYINGKAINEPYIDYDLNYADYGPKDIPKERYFVMGDNRKNSLDSRKWGLLNEELIIGKAVYIFWPLSRIRSL